MSLFPAVLILTVAAAAATIAVVCALNCRRVLVDVVNRTGHRPTSYPAAGLASGPVAGAGEYFYCRNCNEVIEPSPPGWAIPFVHTATRQGGCRPELVTVASWAEPALPQRWVADALSARAAAFDAEDVTTISDRGPACLHCYHAIEASNAPAGGHPWTHVLSGPACWLQGAEPVAALFGKLATPTPAAVDVEDRPKDCPDCPPGECPIVPPCEAIGVEDQADNADAVDASARAAWAHARQLAGMVGGQL